MRTWNERLVERRIETEMTQAELARQAGVKPPTVYEWEAGITKTLKGPNLLRVCRALGVMPLWLLYEKGPKFPGDGDEFQSVDDEQRDTRTIPIISTVQAGLFTSVADPYPVGFGDGEIPVHLLPVPVGPNAFGLRVKGDSMREEYYPGDLVVIDPLVSARPSDPVVARRDEDDESTFKLYHPRGNDDAGNPIIELLPINTHFPALIINAEHPGHIIGPMVARIHGRRNNGRTR